jgi:hypothetical protein
MKPRINLNRSYGWNLSRNNVEITQRIWDGPDCYPWREVFAIWPVRTISGRYVWLKKVYKRRFWAVWGTGFHMEPEVEYGTVFDMLQDTQ